MKIVNNVISDLKVFTLKKITPGAIEGVLTNIHFQAGVDLYAENSTKSLTVKVWWGLGEGFSEESKIKGIAIVEDTMGEIKEIISEHEK